MTLNKIWVVGAGAVGGYLGARLFRAGTDVTFLVRPKTYTHISKRGIEIRSPDGDFSIHPPFVQNIESASHADLIVLSVKCYDLLSALTDVMPLVKKGALLLTLQNGVDSEERIQSLLTGDSMVAGVAYITARLAEPGVVEHFCRGTITLGELSGEKSDRAKEIHALFEKAGIPSKLTSQIRNAKWTKLCWNATFNPLSVILHHPISLILGSSVLLEIVREGIREVMAVARAEGVVLNDNVIEETISTSEQFKDYYTSMYEDYCSGKQTEIEHLNGDIIRRGERGGIPVPVNKMLYALMKGLEMGREKSR